jgi:predicted amidophosphoribosyltransferase
MTSQNIRRRNLLSIWVLIIIIMTILSLTFIFIFGSTIWWILIPISFFIIVIFQAMSHFFWIAEKYCPRCNVPTSIYAKFCRNCGLTLLHRCPSCGKYLLTGTQFCDNCNYEFKYTEEEMEPVKYEIVQKGSPAPLKPNYCSSCGAKLSKEEDIKYCEECGAKIE